MKIQTAKAFLATLTVVLATVTVGCSSVKGTYSDFGDSTLLDLRSGGEAALTFGGETAACTYSSSGNQLTLDCKPPLGKVVFTIHDDGSLTGPPGGFLPALRKKK